MYVQNRAHNLPCCKSDEGFRIHNFSKMTAPGRKNVKMLIPIVPHSRLKQQKLSNVRRSSNIDIFNHLNNGKN